MDDWGNIYNNPSKFGLRIVKELSDQSRDGYEWGYLVVWVEDKTGKLYWDSEGGCSCWAPWEDVKSVEKLKPLTKATYDEFAKAVREYDAKGVSKSAMIRKVDRLLYGD